jgi:hypothetical protein
MGELVRRIRQADSAKEKLVVSNLRLVISVAKNYCSYGLPLVDLVQVSHLALIVCILSKGAYLSLANGAPEHCGFKGLILSPIQPPWCFTPRKWNE